MRLLIAAVMLVGLGACSTGRPLASGVPSGYCDALPGLLLEAEHQPDMPALYDAYGRAFMLFFSEKVGDPATSPAYAVAEAIRVASPPNGRSSEPYLTAIKDAREKVERQCKR